MPKDESARSHRGRAELYELVENISAAIHHETAANRYDHCASIRHVVRKKRSTGADASKREFSEKQVMQDSRYVISPITAWSWMQSAPTRSTHVADQEVGSSGRDTETSAGQQQVRKHASTNGT